ncbi:MAG: DUF4173 domain-containing protein [Pseudomonadota bacterium]
MTSCNGLVPAGRAFLGHFTSRFWTKAVAALVLLLLADTLFIGAQGFVAGSTFGLFAASLLAIVWLTRVPRPALSDHVLGIAALGLCLALFDDPGPLAALLLWSALALLVLRPTFRNPADARDLALKLGVFTLTMSLSPFRDLGLLRLARKRRSASTARLAPLILPAAVALLFGLLFVWANPVLENFAASFDGGGLFALLTVNRLILWAFTGMIVWSLLRTGAIYLPKGADYEAEKIDWRIVRLFSARSVLIALVLCNGIFALQNGLDLTYLWAGGTLPHGLTHAQYAHRGAYPLVLTALLAGAFVLVALRRRAPREHAMRIRALIYLWLAQNVFLVASAMLRTLNYIEDYSLTLLRLSALIWMGLVAFGLVLIVARILMAKTGRWLINANALAAAGVLYALAFADLSGVIAHYNVHHTSDVGRRGQTLDMPYLASLGPAALPAFDRYISRMRDAPQAGAARQYRKALYDELALKQQDWRSWTSVGQRLLASLPPSPAPRMWHAPQRKAP